MKKLILLLSVFALVGGNATTTSAQKKQTRKKAPKVQNVTINYQWTYNNIPTKAKTTITAEKGITKISVNKFETQYLDYTDSMLYSMCDLGDRQFSTATPFEVGANFQKVGVDTILNWPCVKYHATVKSNSIQVWATEELGFEGTPITGYGVPKGMVLKVVRNGNETTEAVEVKRGSGNFSVRPEQGYGELMSAVDYRWEVNNKDVIVVNVFKDHMLGFNGAKGPEEFDQSNFDTVYNLGGGSVLLRKVKLPEDVEKYMVFVDLKQQAVGDAYDRTGSLFVIPQDGGELNFLDAMRSAEGMGLANMPSFAADQSDSISYPGIIATEGYNPPVELMRFFTPFGVGGYNNYEVKGQKWVDSVVYRSEVSHLAPLLKGEAWIGVYIGNWTNNGHKVSLDIKFHPNARNLKAVEDRPKEVVVPVFNTVNLMEQAGQLYPTFFGKRPLTVKFHVEKPIKNPILVYTTSGHGGWGGGDEFNPKNNIISLDQKQMINYTPWRMDCATYRGWNPSSGNFSTGLSSSDLSRSSWCPGTVTNPIFVELSQDKERVLEAGWHTITVEIPQGANAGNSFSYWCISGVVIGQEQ